MYNNYDGYIFNHIILNINVIQTKTTKVRIMIIRLGIIDECNIAVFV